MKAEWRIALSLLVGSPLAGVGCRPKDPPACPYQVAAERADEADTRLLATDVWYQTLLDGVSRRPLSIPEKPRECRHVLVAVKLADEELMARDPRAKATKLPRRVLGDADIIFGDATRASDQLVWARIDYFDDGTAIGPVALARWDEKGVEIRAIGTLHAPATRPSIRLESFGDEESEEGVREVLVATGERCRGDEAEACQREVYLLPLIDQAFVQAGLFDAEEPAGPARVVLREVDEAERSQGWLRKAEVLRVVKYGGQSLQISEHIEQRNCPPSAAASECVLDETSDKVRTLSWDERRQVFVSNERSAWAGAQGGEL